MGVISIEGSFEIARSIETAYRDDPPYMLDLLRNLYDATKDHLFEDKIEEVCKENELCPECFGDLEVNKEEDPVGEYMGSPAYETIYERKCTKCGRIIE